VVESATPPPLRDRPFEKSDDGPELAGARQRVHRSERRALDRALALRDEAARLVVVAEEQAARNSDEATAEAAELRCAARAEVDVAPAGPVPEVSAGGDVGGAPGSNRPVAEAVLGGARAEADATLAGARAEAERLVEAAGERAGGPPVGPGPAGDEVAGDVQALVALVEPVEAEGGVIAAELTAVRDDLETDERTATPEASSPALRRWAGPLAVASIVSLAAVMRVWDLGAVGFNTDEAVYAGQAASIAGDATLSPFFPIFRAHPLLFQTIVSLVYLVGGTDDTSGRLVSAAVGVVTVWLAYLTGSLLYGRRAGVAGALVLAVMPYHVIVTRQVLLDGTLAMFASLTLYMLAKFATTGRRTWLLASGAAMGLTFLSKEIGFVWFASIFAFLALAPALRVRLRDLAMASVAFVIVALPYPLSLVFAGRSDTGQSFLAWQLFRRPNHDWKFYAEVVPPALGWSAVGCAVLAVVLLRSRRTWRETLLLAWIAVPTAFFLLWPVKGFQYLLPIAMPTALLAGRFLAAISRGEVNVVKRIGRPPVVGAVALALVVGSLAIPTMQRIQPDESGTFLAGTGGVVGGREAGTWVRANVPAGAQMLALGPSMANIIQFYGERRVYGLAVSPNPLHRNPTYTPVVNPDLQIRRNEIQYLVWDSYSASRSPFFAEHLLRYAERYHGRIVHTETVTATGNDGEPAEQAVIVIYEVRPT
jgi:4-amino-4-deoxy-L-arabinose transferase-like glycosyltransferase